MLGFRVEKNHQGYHLVTDRQCRAWRTKKRHSLDDTCRLVLDFSLGGGRLNNDSLFLVIGSDRGFDHSSSLSVTKV